MCEESGLANLANPPVPKGSLWDSPLDELIYDPVGSRRPLVKEDEMAMVEKQNVVISSPSSKGIIGDSEVLYAKNYLYRVFRISR